MQRFGLSVAALLGMMTLVWVIPQNAQNASTQPSPDEHAKRSIAISLLRVINTAEVMYKNKHGNYATWDTLVTSDEFRNLGMRRGAQNTQISTAPEIPSGWMLRLNLIDDGAGYDVQLEDTTDKACGYAASSDERAVIRQSKTIDCDIP